MFSSLIMTTSFPTNLRNRKCQVPTSTNTQQVQILVLYSCDKVPRLQCAQHFPQDSDGLPAKYSLILRTKFDIILQLCVVIKGTIWNLS